ncbi:putative quinol monooxygenase [Cryptosporangium aurantiacum]|uniref:Antibiotic biosynthesis monooxygenase n=1 Tax=Cryptosporangium aurantiacum TaxID=134849 RepID=A0A1M7PBY3_9ACTN|nr:antibiotic biosynthesis monooxygenase family protein [Cryptosporangium aurantiacum]SHN14064.1 Antibiotic biosynthesis monooxygenase [Cryptosporangium aurantiacum]
MIIIAGALYLDASDRDRYLAGVFDVARLARQAVGCLDFVQSPDPLDPTRINVYERWESDDDLHRFRSSGGPVPEAPPLRSADVHKYRIASVEQP